LVHELGHAVNKNLESKSRCIITPESKYIMQRNKKLTPEETKMFLQSAKDSGKPISKLMGDKLHDIAPSENKSDVDAFKIFVEAA